MVCFEKVVTPQSHKPTETYLRTNWLMTLTARKSSIGIKQVMTRRPFKISPLAYSSVIAFKIGTCWISADSPFVPYPATIVAHNTVRAAAASA